MENIVCKVEECKYNHGRGCSAQEITVGTSAPQQKASCAGDTACEKFECR
ncbi:MAG: DUF1540 domain-containing protein [Bacillota bacterium]|jgi:hypothetical protein